MSSSTRPADPLRLVRLFCGVTLGVGACGPASAATPVPLAPCRIGAIALARDMPLASVQASVRRAFPAATMAERPSRDGGRFRNVEVREGADRLMTIVYLKGSPAKLVNRIDLTSSRFQFAAGVAPGTPLADVRALGVVTIEDNPTTSVEDIAAPKLQPTLARWEQAGCAVQLRGPQGIKSGIYPRGRSDTARLRPGAKIASIEIDL